ncbi:2-oxo-4-hydroxy-4-carboxy-5-ureidoimidazoline decarboxylase-like [Ylistrum balloti]|uniref:2-oxo-4-hydroxy-4-carboxy-5-ureidoimidazoline decarboxylase-like n=1 Tax=Ylistrum balloti TaxID=509963 RepID=UPI002905AB04|nr:2-oxo-4-hydroxy-4-carboxy-5-ureidoimidazoline decarboxylase-like [Ylistrum balloti]
MLLTIDDVNKMTSDQFIDVFGNIVEHCSLCAAAVWQHRPFQDVHHFHKVVCEFLDNLPVNGKQGVLRLHPDLAGNVAGGLTLESHSEQKSAGIDSLTLDEKGKIQERNKNYRDKFNFPFVICARKNKKEAILEGLELRLQNSNEEEVANGIEQVKLIALLRMLSIVEE